MTLRMWTIYDHPSDYPDCFVAREFVLDKPTDNLMAAPDIEMLRGQFIEWGKVCITRSPEDDPKLVETWI